METVRVLGSFAPTLWFPDDLERAFRALPFLPACCRRERVSVRVPQGLPTHPDNLAWHQDGGGAAGTTKHMVVWASEQPTEIRDGNAVFETPIGSVVWFDNTVVEHRQPAGTNERRRWFIAIRCSGA